jgi:hypothetical protein
MNDEASPRPWHTANFINGIEDANNGKVAANIRDADAKLIVDAVNFYDATVDTQLTALLSERDRLRDLVKRMIPFVEKCHSDALDLSKTIKGICALKGVDTSEIDRINSEHDALIAEARAAIGEDKP